MRASGLATCGSSSVRVFAVREWEQGERAGNAKRCKQVRCVTCNPVSRHQGQQNLLVLSVIAILRPSITWITSHDEAGRLVDSGCPIRYDRDRLFGQCSVWTTMECAICEHRQRRFICQACVRTHVRELRAQISKAGDERQVEVEKAAKLLGSGVEKERWARAETYALEASITAVKAELVARRVANQKGAWRCAPTKNLKLARDFLPSTVSPSHTTSSNLAAGPSQENTIPFATSSSPPSTASRLSRLFPFPSASTVAPPSAPPPRRHKPPNPLTEAKQALSNVADALSEGRAALVRELAEAYELQEECRTGPGGQEEYIWTLGRMELPNIDDLPRFKPSLLHTTLYNALHFMRLTSFYLGVKLPFEIGWGASSTLSPPFPSLFIPGAADTNKLETINEDGAESSGTTLVGVGTPWIVAGRGLGGTTDGGWGKCVIYKSPRITSPSPHRCPDQKRREPPTCSNFKTSPTIQCLSRKTPTKPFKLVTRIRSREICRGFSILHTPLSTFKHNRDWTSYPIVNNAKFPTPPTSRVSIDANCSPNPNSSDKSCNHPDSIYTSATARADDRRTNRPDPDSEFCSRADDGSVQRCLFGLDAGCSGCGECRELAGYPEPTWSDCCERGYRIDHALPPPTRSFPLSFPALLGHNLGLIGGLGSAGLPSQEGDGEWDLVEASEEEDGVG
ncbi:Atg14 domain-containing protein [Rhizoctonia solani AG-1 IA]|uniref:Autophagy-related protein 14 n=1 Tax=Thanatephorus cucumeris (strain AG1-IA) TaxID=983506 RepID=L8WKQ3_THACA|nr:Atg14 domain-containing protein [Rhizoctonia solani AG-1 IA]